MLIDDIKNIKSSRKDLRNFGLVVGGALVILATALWWYDRPNSPWFGGSGVALILLGLVFPPILKPLQKVWMTFAVVMGWMMTRVILCLLFFLVFTPMGLISRLIGKEFLAKKWPRSDDSYWNRRQPQEYDPKRTETQF